MIIKQSKTFTKTLKETPSGEEALNAILLERGGFIYKTSAGVYALMPLGWKVINKIANIIREEMDAIGGQELFLPAMVDKKYWEKTGRWDIEIGYEVSGKEKEDADYVLGWSHEDLLTDIALKYIESYKDLPKYVYQIQTKFRNEPRAKSGLLRGKEFMMKDLYSFHVSEEDLMTYYEKVAEAYKKIFNRVGVKTFYTLAPGGDFTSSNTHEFQAPSAIGEDVIFTCSACEYAENKEISNLKEGDKCPKCNGQIEKIKAIEVGNIFPLGTKYSEAVGLKFASADKGNQDVFMGSYGIGLGRLMATVVETSNDDNGIIWPKNISPFHVHLLQLGNEASVVAKAEEVVNMLNSWGLDVLWDEREKTPGEKFADRDLIGISTSVIISQRNLEKDQIELFDRKTKKSQQISVDKLKDYLFE